jgi:hypothetical protein
MKSTANDLQGRGVTFPDETTNGDGLNIRQND